MTLHVCQDGKLCLGKTPYLPHLGKPSYLLNQFQNIAGLKMSKTVQHKLFYDFLLYLLLFGLGGAVNTADEKKSHRVT